MQKSGDYEIPNLVEKSFDVGDVIIREGEYDTGAYKIIEGEVEVSIKNENSDVKLATLGKGAFFGEMTLIDHKPHSASVTALTDVECIFFEKEMFEHELAESSPVIQEMLRAFSKRLRGADDRICSEIS